MVGSSSGLEPLYREKLLTEVKSPLLADLIPESIAPHRQWASVYLNTFVQAYNTKLVQKTGIAEGLARPAQSALEGQARGRGGGLRLVRPGRAQSRRGAGAQAVPRHRCDQRHLGAARAFRAEQPDRRRRSAARADRLRLHRPAGQAQGRAARLVRDPADDCAADRRRRCPQCPASACGGAVL